MRTVAKPGIAMFELVETLEDKVRQLIEVSCLQSEIYRAEDSSRLMLVRRDSAEHQPKSSYP